MIRKLWFMSAKMYRYLRTSLRLNRRSMTEVLAWLMGEKLRQLVPHVKTWPTAILPFTLRNFKHLPLLLEDRSGTSSWISATTKYQRGNAKFKLKLQWGILFQHTGLKEKGTASMITYTQTICFLDLMKSNILVCCLSYSLTSCLQDVIKLYHDDRFCQLGWKIDRLQSSCFKTCLFSNSLFWHSKVSNFQSEKSKQIRIRKC